MANNSGNINEFFDIDAARQQLNTVSGVIQKYIDLTREAKPIVFSLKIDEQKISQILKGVGELIALTREQTNLSLAAAAAEEKLANARLKDAKAATESAKSSKIANDERIKTEDAARREQRAINALNTPYHQLSRSYSAAALQAKNYALELGRSHPTTVQAIKDAKKLHDQLLELDQSTGDSRRNIGNYQSAFSGLNNALSAISLPTVSFAALGTALNSLTDAAARYASLTAGIRAVTDSSEEQADVLTYLNSIATKYGQSIEVLAGTYKGLAAATKGTSLEGRETRRIFESIVTAGTALKLTNEQVEGSLLAIQQMISKGKVSAEELRGQLGERLPGAYALFAKAAGLTTAELEKQLKAGTVLAQDVLPKFATLLNETYSSKAVENAQGLGNETERLSNAWLSFANSFSNQSGLLSWFATFKRGLAAALTSMSGFINDPSFKTFIGQFTGSNIRESGIEQQRQDNLAKFKNATKEEREEMLKDAEAKVNIYKDKLSGIDLKKLDELNKRIAATREGALLGAKGGVNRFVVRKDTEETEALRKEKDALLGGFTEKDVADLQKRRQTALNDYVNFLDVNRSLSAEEVELEKRRAQEIAEAKGESGKKESDAAEKLRLKLLAENAKKLADARKAAFELEKAEQQRRIDAQAATASFEGFTPETRTAARKQQFIEEAKLIDLTKNYEIQAINDLEAEEIRKAEKEYKNQAGLQELITNIRAEAADKRTAIELKVIDDVQKANAKSLSDILAARLQFNEHIKKDGEEILKLTQNQEKARIEQIISSSQKQLEASLAGTDAAAEAQLNALAISYNKGEINKEQYERRKLEIENNARRESLLAEITHYENLLKVIGLPADKESEYLKKLAALRKQLNHEDLKDTEDTEAAKMAIRQKTNAKTIELQSEVRGLMFDILSGQIDRERNENQDRLDNLDKRKQKEIEVVNQSVASNQEKAAQIKIIESRIQADRENIEARQRKLQVEKAKFERAQNIASIIQSTALAVVGALRPDGVTPLPARITMAGIIGGIGLTQLARAIAVPTPRFAEGTTDAPGGPVYVGDGYKKELVWTPDGKVFKTPASPVLMDVPQHSVIFPDADQVMKLMAGTVTGKNLETINPGSREATLSEDLKKEFKALAKVIKEKKETHYTFQSPIETWVRSGQSWFKRL